MNNYKYTYKFRLKPTKEQEILLNKYFGSVRYVYNYFLNQRKEEYLNNKKSITYNKQAGFLTQLKKNEETEWLKETNSQTLQYSLKCLEISGWTSDYKRRAKIRPSFDGISNEALKEKELI